MPLLVLAPKEMVGAVWLILGLCSPGPGALAVSIVDLESAPECSVEAGRTYTGINLDSRKSRQILTHWLAGKLWVTRGTRTLAIPSLPVHFPY